MGDVATAPLTADAEVIPPLNDGDRLDREEFHRRYEAMGPGVRAELIEGIVYLYDNDEMASPVSLNAHASPHFLVSGWLMHYVARTPGLIAGIDGSVLLDGINEPQPDVLLGIPTSAGGQTEVVTRSGKEYVAGGPELVVEVSASTARVDLNAKLRAYARNGVREYLVVLADRKPAEVRWFTLDPVGEPTPIELKEDALESRVFPGLRLDPTALIAGDAARLLVELDEGLSAQPHADFAGRVRLTKSS
ncbi:MAG: Uma2 family endonuclease [Planctomycetota bacterium]